MLDTRLEEARTLVASSRGWPLGSLAAAERALGAYDARPSRETLEELEVAAEALRCELTQYLHRGGHR